MLTLSRSVYYVVVIAFMVATFMVSLFANSSATGTQSDIYLGLMVVSALLAGLSVYYGTRADNHQDDDTDVNVSGLPVSKPAYYIGVLLIAAWRAVEGYQLNHSGTGIQSVYGVLWLLGAVLVLVLTWANFNSYRVKHTSPAAR